MISHSILSKLCFVREHHSVPQVTVIESMVLHLSCTVVWYRLEGILRTTYLDLVPHVYTPSNSRMHACVTRNYVELTRTII